MTAISYIGRVQENGTLSLPKDAQDKLGLHPGDEVEIQVSLNRTGNTDAPKVVPNEKALATLRKIAEMQEGRRHTDGSQTERIIREGRAGAMYGHDLTEVI